MIPDTDIDIFQTRTCQYSYRTSGINLKRGIPYAYPRFNDQVRVPIDSDLCIRDNGSLGEFADRPRPHKQLIAGTVEQTLDKTPKLPESHNR